MIWACEEWLLRQVCFVLLKNAADPDDLAIENRRIILYMSCKRTPSRSPSNTSVRCAVLLSPASSLLLDRFCLQSLSIDNENSILEKK
jgi:hypothetical protein